MTTSALSAGERDRLRLTRDGGHARNGRAEVRDHLRQRLDGGDPVPEGDERARQLAGPGAEIDDVARRLAREPAHGILGVAGPRALVGVGDAAERGAPGRGARPPDCTIMPCRLAQPTAAPKGLHRLRMVDDRPPDTTGASRPGSAMSRAGTSASSGT